jgi:hypothetical protein
VKKNKLAILNLSILNIGSHNNNFVEDLPPAMDLCGDNKKEIKKEKKRQRELELRQKRLDKVKFSR